MNTIIRKEENKIKNTNKNKNTHLNIDIDRKSDINEGFDGIRKSNSRIIFGILLGIIILDFTYECWN